MAIIRYQLPKGRQSDNKLLVAEKEKKRKEERSIS